MIFYGIHGMLLLMAVIPKKMKRVALDQIREDSFCYLRLQGTSKIALSQDLCTRTQQIIQTKRCWLEMAM